MPPHPLKNFEIHNYYQHEPKFNGVYSRKNLPKLKYRAYLINLENYKSIGTHWKALYDAQNLKFKRLQLGSNPQPLSS